MVLQKGATLNAILCNTVPLKSGRDSRNSIELQPMCLHL